MGQYTINKSNGSSFNIYDLEQNGPNGESTPRQIFQVSLGGGAGFNFFRLKGDLTYRFSAGQQFIVLDSGSNDGSYTTTNSSYDGTYTSISTAEVISGNGLPFGSIKYSIPSNENATSLLLSGRGVINFGESLVENYVKLLEHFASSTAPVDPIVGQFWYKSDTNELFKYDSSLQWSSNINIGSGDITFRDPQNPFDQINPILAISGDDSDVGLSIKTTVDPNPNDSIFRILSAGNNERLRVEHDGYTSTTNAFKSTSATTNIFNSALQFPVNKGIISINTASIQTDISGNTWTISSGNPGISDSLRVNDSSGQSILTVRTDNDSVEVGKDFVVNSNSLYVNSTSNRVGIGTNNPLESLDVVGNIKSSSNLLVSNGTAINPSISFTNNTSIGLRLSGTDLTFTNSGSDKMSLTNSGILRFNTTGYENLVLNDNDVPNKKYVDDTHIKESKLYFYGFGA